MLIFLLQRFEIGEVGSGVGETAKVESAEK